MNTNPMTITNPTIDFKTPVSGLKLAQVFEAMFSPVLDSNEDSPLYIEICYLTQERDSKGKRKFITKSYKLNIPNFERIIGKIKNFNNSYIKHDVFFSVCPRNERIHKDGYTFRTTASNVSWGTMIWADIDFKDYQGGEQQALQKINQLHPFPNIVVRSGNGFHLYWLLKEAEIAEEVSDACRRVGKHVGGDSVYDTPRIMRVPFTTNWKDTQNPKRTKLVHFDDSIRYNLDDFDKFQAVTSPVPLHMQKVMFSPQGTVIDIESVKERFTDDKLYAKIMAEDLNQYREIVTSKCKSRSERDMHICCQLYKSGFSMDEIKGIFEKYPCGDKYREKAVHGDAYLSLTLERAIRAIEEERMFARKIHIIQRTDED